MTQSPHISEQLKRINFEKQSYKGENYIFTWNAIRRCQKVNNLPTDKQRLSIYLEFDVRFEDYCRFGSIVFEYATEEAREIDWQELKKHF